MKIHLDSKKYDSLALKERQTEFEKIAVDYAKAFAASGKEPGEESLKGLAERLLLFFDDAKNRDISNIKGVYKEFYGGDPLKTNVVFAEFNTDGVWGYIEFTKDHVNIRQEEYHWGFINVGPDDCEKDMITDRISTASFDAHCVGGFLEASMAHMDTPEVIAKRQKDLDVRAARAELRKAVEDKDPIAYITAASKIPDYNNSIPGKITYFTQAINSDIKKTNRVVGVSLIENNSEWTISPIVKIPNQKLPDGTCGFKYISDRSLSISGQGNIMNVNGSFIFKADNDKLDFPDEIFENFTEETFVSNTEIALNSHSLTSIDAETEPIHQGAIVVNANWLLERAVDFDESKIIEEYLDDINEPDYTDIKYACRDALINDVEDGNLWVELVIADGTDICAYAVGEGSRYCSVAGEDAEIPLTPTEKSIIFEHFESELIAAKDAALTAEWEDKE